MTLTERRQQAQRDLKHLKDLLASPGWKLLLAVLQGGIRARRQQVFGLSIESMDSIFKLTALKHEAEGLRLAVGQPFAIIEELERDIELLLEQEREKLNA
jgi:hypothetical protein